METGRCACFVEVVSTVVCIKYCSIKNKSIKRKEKSASMLYFNSSLWSWSSKQRFCLLAILKNSSLLLWYIMYVNVYQSLHDKIITLFTVVSNYVTTVTLKGDFPVPTVNVYNICMIGKWLKHCKDQRLLLILENSINEEKHHLKYQRKMHILKVVESFKAKSSRSSIRKCCLQDASAGKKKVCGVLHVEGKVCG